ncbi:methyl-accepting chemotaxis protein [Hyalangium rubrum]|uniref:Methyl-accepting chemotaxis protein n=1 Tax=Hyalangium rubrum TaxID=3103134 RepID=A0ABU5GVI5_9BACT|nr:methyl-accepting chemotaxis protein [Hyalangium sp. s54d21]MDY7225184.1 methyl-accepting chemotaxis protein [Hyalangium sp. s54d21]
MEVQGIKLSVPGQEAVGRLSLRTKILFITGLTGALVAAILSVVFSIQMRGALRSELATRAKVVSLQLATNLAAATVGNEKASLQHAVDATRRTMPEVAYVVVRDRNDVVLAQAADEEFAKADPVAAPPKDGTESRDVRIGHLQALENSEPIFFAWRGGVDPVDPQKTVPAGEPVRVGTVQVGIKLDSLTSAVRSVAWQALGLSLLVLAVCLAAAFQVSRLLTVPLERLAHAAAGIAAGDLRQQIDARGSDEISELARSFAKMAATVTHLLTDLRSAAADIEREATSALTTSTQQSAMAHEQASAINETSTTVAEIAQTSKQATTYADSVISGTQRSEALSTEGQKVVSESVAGMEKLGEQVRAIAVAIAELNERALQISDIITTVRDVAEQSNLLALNAAIEAAKAGDHGRGFAVVAMEMRALAEQSKVAANQVRALLGEVQKGTKAAVAATDEGSRRASAAMALAQSAGSAILGLAEVIRESSAAARQIAGNTRQQTIGVEQIATAMSELSSAMTDTVSGTRQIEQVAGNLTNLSKRFSELVGRYQL